MRRRRFLVRRRRFLMRLRRFSNFTQVSAVATSRELEKSRRRRRSTRRYAAAVDALVVVVPGHGYYCIPLRRRVFPSTPEFAFPGSFARNVPEARRAGMALSKFDWFVELDHFSAVFEQHFCANPRRLRQRLRMLLGEKASVPSNEREPRDDDYPKAAAATRLSRKRALES